MYVCIYLLYNCIFIYIAQTIDVTNASINVFEGQSVHLECVPEPDYLPIIWTFNNINIPINQEKINLSPDRLYHQLIINQSSPSDSGVYTCYADTYVGRPALNTTALIVTPGKGFMNQFAALQTEPGVTSYTLCN